MRLANASGRCKRWTNALGCFDTEFCNTELSRTCPKSKNGWLIRVANSNSLWISFLANMPKRTWTSTSVHFSYTPFFCSALKRWKHRGSEACRMFACGTLQVCSTNQRSAKVPGNLKVLTPYQVLFPGKLGFQGKLFNWVILVEMRWGFSEFWVNEKSALEKELMAAIMAVLSELFSTFDRFWREFSQTTQRISAHQRPVMLVKCDSLHQRRALNRRQLWSGSKWVFWGPFSNRRKINFVNWHVRLVVISFMQKLGVGVHLKKKHRKMWE